MSAYSGMSKSGSAARDMAMELLSLRNSLNSAVKLLERHAEYFLEHESCTDMRAEILELIGQIRAAAPPATTERTR